MKIFKLSMRSRFILALLVIGLTAVACVPPRIGVSWPAQSVVNIYDEDHIVVSHAAVVGIVDPSTGAPIRLLNAEGEVRRDENGETKKWQLDGTAYDNAQFYVNPVSALEGQELWFTDHNLRVLQVNAEAPSELSTTSLALPDHVIADWLVTEDRYFIPFQSGGVGVYARDSFEAVCTFETSEGVWSTPLLEGDVLYVGSLNHMLYAIDPATCEEIWSTDLGGGITSTPAYHDGHLYVGTFIHNVYDIDANSGSIIAEYKTQNWVWSTPLIRDDTLYVSDLDGYVHALLLADFSPIWSTSVSAKGIRPSPIYVGDALIVADRAGAVYWINPSSGDQMRKEEIDGQPEILSDILLIEPSETMQIAEPLIVVSTVDPSQLLVAFTLDGLKLWTYGQ